MTPQEARSRLGLEPSGALEKAELRRAYLQAIKKHKPEVDPEGFKAVRQAYELLDGLMQMGVSLAEAPAGNPIAVPVAPAAPGETGPPPARTDHLKTYRDRLAGMFGLPWPQRAEVGWEAFEAFPGDPAAREFLLELLPEEARSDIITVLLDGVRTGDPSCLFRLLHFAPASVPAEIIDRMEAEGNTFERLLAADALVARDQGDRALTLLGGLVDAAAGQPPEPLLIERTMRLILLLEERRDLARANQARAQLRRHLGTPSLPAELASPETAIVFALITDLEKADYLPEAVRVEVAKGALQGHWSGLPGVLAVQERSLGQGPFERKLDRLRLEAPALSTLIVQHRAVQQSLTAESSAWSGRALPVTIILLLLAGGRALTGGSCQESRPVDPTFLKELSTVRTVQVQHGSPASVMARVLELRQELLAVCRDTLDSPLCRQLSAYLKKIDGDTLCGPLLVELFQLRKDQATQAQWEFVQRLQSETPGLCTP